MWPIIFTIIIISSSISSLFSVDCLLPGGSCSYRVRGHSSRCGPVRPRSAGRRSDAPVPERGDGHPVLGHIGENAGGRWSSDWPRRRRGRSVRHRLLHRQRHLHRRRRRRAETRIPAEVTDDRCLLNWTGQAHNIATHGHPDVTLTFRNHAVTHAPLSNGVTIWQRMLKRVVNTSNVYGNSVG